MANWRALRLALQKCTKLEPLAAFQVRRRRCKRALASLCGSEPLTPSARALWSTFVAQDAQRSCAKKLLSERMLRALRTARKQVDDTPKAQPERSTSSKESEREDAGGVEASQDVRCVQCGSSVAVPWFAGPMLCTDCEMLNVCLDQPLAPLFPPGAALQAAMAAPGAAPSTPNAAQPVFAHPEVAVQSEGAHALLGQTLPAIAPAPLSMPELVSAPSAPITADAGGSAELNGASLPSSEEQAAAAAAAPQPPSVSPPPPQPLALAPAPPAVLPAVFLPLVHPPAAMLPALVVQAALAAASQAPPPAPPALQLALPHMMMSPTAAILLAAAAGAHASVVEAQGAEAQLRASQVLAAAMSVPVVNPAMILQLQQLPMPHMPMPQPRDNLQYAGQAALANLR